MIESFRLPIQADAAALQADLERLRNASWIPHYNTNDYSGDWCGISLRSPNGKVESIYADPSAAPNTYRDTAWMDHLPSVREVLRLLHCQIGSVRLLRLAPGAIIKEHRDHALSFEQDEVRLHFPLVTNDAVEFFSNGAPIEMREGECWYVNAGLPHRAANRGTTDRIHLVVDCVVNDWLRGFFPTVEVREEDGTATITSDHARRQMVASLETMNSKTSIALASELRERWGFGAVADDSPSSELDVIIDFVRMIGITVRFDSVGVEAVLPGIRIERGGLVIDRDSLLYPGDVLHEAGHIAVAPKDVRESMDGALDPQKDLELAGELMTLPWTYAAALHIGIDPAVVFHPHGYHGGSDSLLENFTAGRYIGVPALEWAGMTLTGTRADEAGVPPFPYMIRWIRE